MVTSLEGGCLKIIEVKNFRPLRVGLSLWLAEKYEGEKMGRTWQVSMVMAKNRERKTCSSHESFLCSGVCVDSILSLNKILLSLTTADTKALWEEKREK